MRKIYVDVKAIHTKNGTIRPLAIYWQDEKSGYETEYEIEKILSGPEPRFSKAGGTGKRYIVVIQGQRRALFLEKDRWFIETEK